MKTSIVFVDEFDSSRLNGIGAFRRTIIDSLTRDNRFETTLVSLNSQHQMLEVDYDEASGLTHVSFPIVRNRDWASSGEYILPVLSQYINPDAKHIFVINHSPCSSFLRIIKEIFSNSKIVFIVHNQGWCEPFLGMRQVLEKAILGKSLPLWVACNEMSVVKRFFDEEKEIYRLSDRVVSLSPSTYSVLSEVYKIPRAKISMIPNGVRTLSSSHPSRANIRRELGIRDEEFVLLYVGRPTIPKGFQALLMALKMLVSDIPCIRLVVAGSLTNLNTFNDLIGDVAVSVTFMGHTSKQKLEKLLSASDLGILPSFSEQCSYTALEMMSSDLPLVITNGNGLCDIFQSDKYPYIAEINSLSNPEEDLSISLYNVIVKAYHTIINDRALISKHLRRIVSERFNQTKMCLTYKSMLTEL